MEEEAAVEVEPWSSKARLDQQYVGVLGEEDLILTTRHNSVSE